jgi:hypothetical protein
MIKCLETCEKLNVECPVKDCRYWINYKSERNCLFESIKRNDAMTLREAGDRLGISYVRVKQIQDKALKKISHLLK